MSKAFFDCHDGDRFRMEFDTLEEEQAFRGIVQLLTEAKTAMEPDADKYVGLPKTLHAQVASDFYVELRKIMGFKVLNVISPTRQIFVIK